MRHPGQPSRVDGRCCRGLRMRCSLVQCIWYTLDVVTGCGWRVAWGYVSGYNPSVIEIQRTRVYEMWFRRLRDRRAQGRIIDRVRRLSEGNPGDVRPVGEGVSELRIHYGPGYRVYFVRRGQSVILLLAGGGKDSQNRDIRTALELASDL